MEPTLDPNAEQPQQNYNQDQEPTNYPPQPPQQSQDDGSELNEMVVLQPGERVVCRIKRHPFGLIGTYIVGGFLLVVALLVAIFAGSMINSQASGDSSAAAIVYAAVGVFAVCLVAYMLVATSIYWKNRWIVTSDSLTQILQPSLFGHQVSQLSLNDLEDVTVQQNGMLQSMFGFGTLRAETAGERSKFVFLYCPNPNYYARQILVAREDFMNGKRYTPNARPRLDFNEDEPEPSYPPEHTP